MASTAKDIAGKSLAIFFPIMAFVVSGFEHCVANMYYIPAGIFASMNPDYVAKAKELYGITGSQIAALNWGNFFTVNLLPVTIGNIIGGGFIIGGLFFYLHGVVDILTIVPVFFLSGFVIFRMLRVACLHFLP